ncbi:hypothetical protein D522_00586 [Mycobacterium avium subsp. paratuberculosis S5]|nr:hypothetical protein D522_00586 [Mycobacterium avium subsp. paratuberculosis S5]
MTPKLFADLGKTTMAITDAAEYAHLREADLEALGVALEAIRRDIENRAVNMIGHTFSGPSRFSAASTSRHGL